jgi:hypothetical protein
VAAEGREEMSERLQEIKDRRARLWDIAPTYFPRDVEADIDFLLAEVERLSHPQVFIQFSPDEKWFSVETVYSDDPRLDKVHPNAVTKHVTINSNDIENK